jgi:hypothetical protein
MLQYKNWIGHIADATSIGDFILDAIELQALRKEQKKHRNSLIVTHLILSVLAVGVSYIQTQDIKKVIRKETKEIG